MYIIKITYNLFELAKMEINTTTAYRFFIFWFCTEFIDSLAGCAGTTRGSKCSTAILV